ncbi:hypothetical protein GYA25_03250 [Candidatus Woesearchaeota archaeon]|nr:hypothetical protein [Candidatus Woesearchaeota archaeon]
MEERDRETYLYVVGFVFALIYFYVFSLFIFIDDYAVGLTWMCYLGILLITIGIFLKNSDIVLSQVYLLLIPDLLWLIDFFYTLIFGHSLLGFDNFFFRTPYLERKILSLQHLVTPYLAIFSLYLFKPKKKLRPLLFSFLELIVMFLLGIFVFPASEGINCLPDYNSCFFNRPLAFLNYQFGWILVESFFILTAFFILRKLKFLWSNEKEK